MSSRHPRAVFQAAIDALAEHGNQVAAAKALNLARGTYKDRLREAQRLRLKSKIKPKADVELALAKDEVKRLTAQLANEQRADLNAEQVRKEIIKLAALKPEPPAWLINPRKASSPGVPTLFASDWHWGEVVDLAQVGGVNKYDMAIARTRARTMVETAVHLMRILSPKMDYPGLVFPLGGDMVSGDIHEELEVTNETEIMPTFVDLQEVLIWCIETLADEFGHVFIPCVTGNHGRNTKKIRAKGRNFTSFDWLLYVMLAKHFERDRRIQFMIPDGPDALYRIYSHRYLLTHGDQFRGGDGMIGPLGPIMRGDHKKRSRNAQIAQEYDTMIMGHWHQLMQLRPLIVNGSLKGYDEYANAGNFRFEDPAQALWITHPTHGITWSSPVYVHRRAAPRTEQKWWSAAA